jgi:hypothetical protein
MGAEKKEIIFGGEPIYEVVKDRWIRDAIITWLKAAGFEKWTSYIPTQSNKNELIIQITKLEWKQVSNTGTINLQVWVDFLVKNWVTMITQEWINKMRDNYKAIKNLSQQQVAIAFWTTNSLHNIQIELTA